MNIQRYIMPVIIAAGLHTAILFCSTDTPRLPRPPKDETPPLPPVPRIELTDPPTETGEAGAGKADPLPAQQDIERPVNVEDIFTIQVRPAAEAIKPVLKLPDQLSGLVGIGDGTLDLGQGGRAIAPVTKLDRAPRATVRPAPNYPAAMRSSSTNGSVTVEFVVDTSGRVVSADAIRWTHRDFVDPTLQAVLRWRFEPGTVNGRKVNFRMAIPIEFIAAN